MAAASDSEKITPEVFTDVHTHAGVAFIFTGIFQFKSNESRTHRFTLRSANQKSPKYLTTDVVLVWFLDRRM